MHELLLRNPEKERFKLVLYVLEVLEMLVLQVLVLHG